MKLQDGKLYETADGRRFRVTASTADTFYCRKSYSGFWHSNGWAARTHSEDHLIREVDERRWVPVSFDHISDVINPIHSTYLADLIQVRILKNQHVQVLKEVERPSKAKKDPLSQIKTTHVNVFSNVQDVLEEPHVSFKGFSLEYLKDAVDACINELSYFDVNEHSIMISFN